MRLVLEFDGFYGQDSYEYLRYTEALKDYYLNGTDPGDYFWPVMYPLISSFFSLLIDSKWVLVLISFGSFLGIISLITKIIGELYPAKKSATITNLYVLISFCFSPYFFRSSLIGMSDMLACFFAVSSLYTLLKYNKYFQLKWAILFMVAAVAAVMTRYASAVMILPMGCYFVYLLLAGKRWLTIGTSIVIACLVLMPHFLIRGVGSLNFLGHSWLTNWNPINFFAHSFATHDGFQEHSFSNLLYVFSPFVHPGYLLVGSGLLMFSKFRLKNGAPWYVVAGVFLYLLFLAGVEMQNMRFFVIVFPFCVLLFYPAFVRGRNKLPRVLFSSGVIVAILLQTAYFTYSFSKFHKQQALEKSVAKKIIDMNLKGPIYAFSLDVALTNRGVVNEFKNLWSTKFDKFELGSHVLFNPESTLKQWKGRSPVINWNKLLAEYQLTLVMDFGEGWKLYKIE
ncbi:MAG: hypothetical protein HON99_09865 [Crocinitomicaceae bacterium]|nr:hypothetical protein [Crocinitomicaceae bacterium]